MTIEPGTTMREWEKRNQERRDAVAAAGMVEVGRPADLSDVCVLLERIAIALETLAKRSAL